jgi:hypothetical protein
MDSIILPFFVTNNHVIARNEAIAYLQSDCTLFTIAALSLAKTILLFNHYL